MSLRASLSGWWSAWKYVAILAALLGLSLWGNLHQYVASKTAPLRDENKALTDTLDKVRGIASDKTSDDAKLLDIVQGIADQRVRRETIYSQAAPTPMDANCAPGQARMDAVNNGVAEPTATDKFDKGGRDLLDILQHINNVTPDVDPRSKQ